MLSEEKDRQQKKLFSQKQSPLAKSPGFSPKPSPLWRSSVSSPKPSPLKNSPALGVLKPNKQEKPEKPLTCCASCLGMRSPPSPVQTHHQTISSYQIKLHEQVGRGSTAIIYRGSWKGLEVAVKCMNPDFFYFTEGGVGFFLQEIETLSRQHHPFVLRLVGASLNPPQYGWVVTEFLTMTLKEWLHGKGNKRTKRSIPLPPLKERIAKALEVSQGMQYLHEQKPMLLHRDLKPSNIFMDHALHIRVADFGHARFLSDGEKALTGETGTYIYMAPEVIRHEPYNEKCDVFSYGVILNELITGEHPYIETTYGPTEIALGVSDAKLRPALPPDDGQHGELIDLICQSWDEDMSIRPSFAIITSTLKSIQERLIT
ncbi:hypothetical protein AQUCO_07600110v1 [Aquilegia coerulea]|uniref:Protein kinase domain-containing protein n=1 Tax=Aquilegia coerulea TaxID=218851 RepID=A0A2G5CA34_AQUCA|nr:hypothetical protein AQUCO_07600110v1 [Aquilegia coerulea]